MGWSDYGFPDATMMPSYLPAYALWKAYNERATISRGLGLTDAIEEQFTPAMFREENGVHFSQGSEGMFGGHAWNPPTSGYINHLLDLDQPVEGIGFGGPRLFFGSGTAIYDLLNKYDKTGFGYLESNAVVGQNRPTMLPEWPEAWLYQRYLAYNLLKIRQVPFKFTMQYGATGTAYSDLLPSPQEAFNYAVEHSRIDVLSSDYSSRDGGMGQSTTIINYSQTGGESLFYCSFSRLLKVEIDFEKVPHLAGLPAFLYISADPNDIYDPGYIFDAHGFPIREGDRIITKIPLPWESDGITLPEGGLREGKFGYVVKRYTTVSSWGHWQYAAVDVSSKFELYDDVDYLFSGDSSSSE